MLKKYLLLTLLIISAFVAGGDYFAEAAIAPIYVNVGGTSRYVAPNGKTYLADKPFEPGERFGYVGGGRIPSSEINYRPTDGTNIKTLYQSALRGWEGYRVTELPSGQYLVTLHFIERTNAGPDTTSFDVLLEGQTVLNDFSPYHLAGMDYAIKHQFVVQVSDGVLDIDVANSATVRQSLAGLEVKSYSANASAPSRPTGVQLVNSYNSLQIYWSANSEANLAGYHIYRATSASGPFTKLFSDPTPIARYIDRDVQTGQEYFYKISAIDVDGHESALSSSPVSGKALTASNAQLPFYELTIDPTDLTKLYASPHAFKEYPATLTFEGEQFAAQVRFRGGFGRFWSKKSWKIFLENDSPFPSDRINLHAQFPDWNLMRFEMSTRLFEDVGIRPGGVQSSLLMVNGEFMGVFAELEQLDENFLARTGRDVSASIYKSNHSLNEMLSSAEAYYSAYEKETNQHIGYDDIIAFSELIHLTSDDAFATTIRRNLHVDKYLDNYAVSILSTSDDIIGHNAYYVHDLETNMWEAIPWDFDLAWGRSRPVPTELPIDYGTSNDWTRGNVDPLTSRLLATPAFRAYYCHSLRSIMSDHFNSAVMNPRINALYGSLRMDALRDWHKFHKEDISVFDLGPAEMKDYVAQRRAFLLGELSGYCPTDTDFLTVNEVMADNNGLVCNPADSSSSACTSGWIEVYNAGLLPIDLQGYFLTNDSTNLQKYKITHSTIVAPDSRVVFWATGQPSKGNNHLNFTLATSNSGEVLLVKPNGTTVENRLGYGVPQPDQSFGRLPDGSTNIESFHVPSMSTPNEWVAPIVSAEHSPLIPTATTPVTITAVISDDGEYSPPRLFYSVDDSGFFIGTDIHPIGNDTYEVAIPPQPSGTRVQYFVQARDLDSQLGRSSQPLSDEPQEYVVDYVRPSIIINEFMPDNESLFYDPVEVNETPDWIELYNPGPHVVQLKGMLMADSEESAVKHQFSDELAIGVNDYLVLYADNDIEQGATHLNFKLENSGEAVVLYDDSIGGFSILDGIAYGPTDDNTAFVRCADGWHQLSTSTRANRNSNCGQLAPQVENVTHVPGFPTATDSVQVRVTVRDNGAFNAPILRWSVDGGAYNSVAMNSVDGRNYTGTIPAQAADSIVSYYISVTDSTNLTTLSPANAPEYSYHYRANFARPEVYINEVQANNLATLSDPQEEGEFPDWIELHNPSTAPIDLSGMYLTNDPGDPTKFQIPNGVEIPAGDFIVFFADDDVEQGKLHTNFTLAANYGFIGLYAADGVVQIDQMQYHDLAHDQSHARVPDGIGTGSVQTCVNPGASNGCGAAFLPLMMSP